MRDALLGGIVFIHSKLKLTRPFTTFAVFGNEIEVVKRHQLLS